jgi:small subunit ribosomal protein S8e
MQWHLRSNRTKTGKLLKKNTKKHKKNRGRDFLPARIGARKSKRKMTRGGGEKLIVLVADTANVVANGRAQKSKIVTVTDNPADSQFVRRNIITKGAIIQTELGKARVTSRPGQDGVINAVLIEPKGGK